jgi:catechol 2,3-dioxygenase-like lactoylglutathione lyase family enzyme
MIDHLTIGSHRFDAASAFYTECFKTLGVALHEKNEQHAAYGKGEQWTFFVYPAEQDATLNGNRMHVAFAADSMEAVHAFYDTALAQGATAIRPPGDLPSLNERYYGAMCKDLDQHAVEVVYWRPAA